MSEAPLAAAPAQANARLTFPLGRRYAYMALGFLMLLYCVSWMHRMMISMFLEPIRADLDLSDTQLGILSGAAFVMLYAFAALPIARLADRYSRPVIMAVCIGVWTAATACTGLAQNFIQLVLARMGVGVGESGYGPIAGSLLASYFPKERLGSAIALWTSSAALGIALSYPTGAWLLTHFGWQHALIAAGAPAIALSVIALFALKEPRDLMRGLGSTKEPDEVPSLSQTFKLFAAKRTTLYLCLGGAVITYGDAAIYSWFPTFMIRSHGAAPEALGLVLGVVIGISQAGSLLISGVLLDTLLKRDARWAARIPALCALLAAPIMALVFLTPNPDLALWLLTVPLFLSAAYYAPALTLMQLVVPERMRAVAVAMLMLSVNVFGFGVGPLAIGFLSDMLSAQFEQQALRYALLTAAGAYLLASFGFVAAAGRVASDIDQAATVKGAP